MASYTIYLDRADERKLEEIKEKLQLDEEHAISLGIKNLYNFIVSHNMKYNTENDKLELDEQEEEKESYQLEIITRIGNQKAHAVCKEYKNLDNAINDYNEAKRKNTKDILSKPNYLLILSIIWKYSEVATQYLRYEIKTKTYERLVKNQKGKNDIKLTYVRIQRVESLAFSPSDILQKDKIYKTQELTNEEQAELDKKREQRRENRKARAKKP